MSSEKFVKSNILESLSVTNSINQALPLSELEQNCGVLISKLSEVRLLYFVKDDSIVTAMIDVELLDNIKAHIESQQNYIEELQDHIAILEGKLDGARTTFEEALKIL